MSITTLPPFHDMLFTTGNGALTSDANLYLDQFTQVVEEVVTLLNARFVSNGLTLPALTTAQINTEEPNAPVPTLWFNSTIGKLQLKTAPGTIETVTSV